MTASGSLAVAGLGPGKDDWITPEVSAALAEAKSRYGESLQIKRDFHDAAIALAQHAYESARLLSLSGGDEAEARERTYPVDPIDR